MEDDRNVHVLMHKLGELSSLWRLGFLLKLKIHIYLDRSSIRMHDIITL